MKKSKTKNTRLLFDDRMSVGRGFSRLTEHETKSGETYIDGSVVTPHGIVLAYSQGDANFSHYTRFDVVQDGVLHIRSIKRRYTKRGLVTLAKRFAAEVAESTL